MNEAIDNSYSEIESLRDTISNAPRITSNFNKAKRNAVNAIDDFLLEVLRTSTTTSEILEMLENTEG